MDLNGLAGSQQAPALTAKGQVVVCNYCFKVSLGLPPLLERGTAIFGQKKKSMQINRPTIVRSKTRLGFKSLVLDRRGVPFEIINHKRRAQVSKFLRRMRKVNGFELRQPQ